MKKKKILLISILVLFLTPIVYLTVWPQIKGIAFTLYLKIPASETIYEKNGDAYPKTIIELPEEEGYLIAVYKDVHELHLLKNNEIIKKYDVNIRNEKIDRKVWEDDQSPEGVFTIESMDVVTDPAWKRWMRLDTTEKAHEIYKESFADGGERIKEFEDLYGPLDNDEALREFNEINSDQKILRGIGIHGGGFSIYRDWTLGCIAMSNKDIIDLYSVLQDSENTGMGTTVVIQD
jgi:L,D-transpeptidase-like protein